LTEPAAHRRSFTVPAEIATGGTSVTRRVTLVPLVEVFTRPRGISPVLLGDGVRLFDLPGRTNIKLERVSLTHAPKATNLWLRVVG
jgi:hypothetical protein